MKHTNPKVDAILSKEKKWQKEMSLLRDVVLECGLVEELKWGQPCYTHDDTNIVLIHGFKEYCALLFFKGALLKDPKGILVQQTENVQAARQLRFTDAKQVVKLKATIKSFVKEAIAVEKAGLKVTMKKTSEFSMPEEFQKALDKNKGLKKAFDALTPGRQRAYLLYFSQAKQSKTREARIEKCAPAILKGKGLND
jgi:uncharacterized protein YdeI (YjbR/CyaY-like superfamily)